MSWWQWVLLVTGAIVWLALAMFVLALLLDPGKGWALSCNYGNWTRTKYLPDEGPECEYRLTPRWWWPEWTKYPRHWLHWHIRHHGAPANARRTEA